MEQQVKLYECMYIVDPGLSSEEIEEVITGVQGALDEVGAAYHADYEWARRRLAYRIKGFTEGIYRIVYFDGTGEAADMLLRHTSMDQHILRAMVFVANPKTIFRPREPAPEEPAGEEGAEEGAVEAAEEAPAAAEAEAPAADAAPAEPPAQGQ